MSARLTKLLHVRGHRLKAEWVRRLHAKPPKTALSHADILIHRMDETIGELAVRIKTNTHARDLAETVSLQVKLRKICVCGLNPLMDYFLIGDEVISTVLTKLTAAEKIRLTKAWHTIALRDVENLCGACYRKEVLTQGRVLSGGQRSGAETTRAR